MLFNTPAMAGVLAHGDGVVITTEDIAPQKEYFYKQGFETSDAEHLKSVLKMRLFVLEAKATGIIDKMPEAIGPYQYQLIHEYNQQFLVYVNHLLKTYPVSDDAIRSYYLSNPDKFLLSSETLRPDFIKNDELLPLDDGVKRIIHNKIATARKVTIIANEFERLKTKYHVVIE